MKCMENYHIRIYNSVPRKAVFYIFCLGSFQVLSIDRYLNRGSKRIAVIINSNLEIYKLPFNIISAIEHIEAETRHSVFNTNMITYFLTNTRMFFKTDYKRSYI